MATNFLHIKHPDVEKAQNDVDYLYQIIKVIHGIFPEGYIELKTFGLSPVWNPNSVDTMERLKAARVDVTRFH